MPQHGFPYVGGAGRDPGGELDDPLPVLQPVLFILLRPAVPLSQAIDIMHVRLAALVDSLRQLLSFRRMAVVQYPGGGLLAEPLQLLPDRGQKGAVLKRVDRVHHPPDELFGGKILNTAVGRLFIGIIIHMSFLSFLSPDRIRLGEFSRPHCLPIRAFYPLSVYARSGTGVPVGIGCRASRLHGKSPGILGSRGLMGDSQIFE